MDSFWIYILIFGAIISLSQKAEKRKAPQPSDEQSDPQDELERRIRDILEGRPTTSEPPRPAPASQKPLQQSEPTLAPRGLNSPKQATQPSARIETQSSTKKFASITAERQYTPSYKQTRKTGATIPTIVAKEGNNIKNNAPKQENPQTDIDRIVEDFTMEKAVIYAEILKPKFEEY